MGHSPTYAIIDKNSISEIKILKEEFGEDYLYKEMAKLKDLSKEIIIAVENSRVYPHRGSGYILNQGFI